MNKNYYKRLERAWYEASISSREERRLKRFLSSTDDPDFDEIKAVMGYFSVGRSFYDVVPKTRMAGWAYAVAAFALVAIVAISVYTDGLNREKAAISSMESTLYEFFSSGGDIESTLTDIFNHSL